MYKDLATLLLSKAKTTPSSSTNPDTITDYISFTNNTSVNENLATFSPSYTETTQSSLTRPDIITTITSQMNSHTTHSGGTRLYLYIFLPISLTIALVGIIFGVMYLKRKLNWPVMHRVKTVECSPGSFAELVFICLENGSIISTTDFSRWISSGLYGTRSIATKLARYHRNHSLSFFIISSTISIGCILLSLYVSGLTLAYLALNICLILPTLIHHNVISRVWSLIKPILTRVEAEFDRNPLESPEKHDASE
ncbi:hypothetical protein MN116_002678 [Schistosoma mekongi]|uniref:RETREG1-3/ARL6IP-like N-terminal reticulon-homology domain-containing protein n=1 Tax=Schistosoma mekongi TaxID=38744 RepID=A0AAE1ZED3_SCHME|nr:hypothetical protein MN116_002678 [Schistosoma mekongi]